jgi:hypothetical protein
MRAAQRPIVAVFIAGSHPPVEFASSRLRSHVSGDGKGVYQSSSTPAGGRIAR